MRWADESRVGRPFSKDPSVIRFRDHYLMYFSLPPSTNRNDPPGWAIGIAESANLVDWRRVGELLPAQECDQNGLCAPGAFVQNGKVHLFYQTYGNGPRDAICHAVSADGIHFERDASNPIFRPTGDWNNGRAIDAEVFPVGRRLLLYFATRDPAGKVQKLGVATADLDSDFSRGAWQQACEDSILQPELPWERDCIEAPTLCQRNGTLFMFYAGGYNNAPQQIGVATSQDGLTWTRLSDEPFLTNGQPGEWNSSESGHPGVFVDHDGQTYLFFQGNNDKGKTWWLACVKLEWADGRPRLAARADAASDSTATAPTPAVKWHPGHYVFVGQGQILPQHLTEHFRGIQKLYTWSDLEPAEECYDFTRIRDDLALLKPRGKQLVLQIQYKAFGKGQRRVPAYVQGPEYGGGVYQASSGSFDPVLWNARVGQRMDALFAELGRQFDHEPGVEAVVLPETSPSAQLDKRPQPGVEPYTVELYVAALKERMTALRSAFPRTVVIQYANFPQAALPELTTYMQEIGVGLGGPDVYPRASNLSDPERGVYRLYAPLSGTVPLGAAVQSPDYSVASWKRTAAFNRGQDRDSVTVTPEEVQPIPVREHLELARQTLKLNYLFWSANPKECLENVKRMLAEPDLVDDPAGGLDAKCPTRAFRR